MILRRGEFLSLFLSLVCMQLCYANECIEAVEEACSQVIEENNDQLLETMEEMVANRSCDNSAPLFDDDIILNISNQFKDIIKDDLEIIRNTTKEQFEQLSQKLVHSMLDVSTELPVSDVQYEVAPTTIIRVPEDGYFKQLLKLAKTCDDLARCGLTESGEYELDPDGPMFGEEPIRVFCNFATNSTVIRPDSNEIKLQNCDSGPACASVNISYGGHMDQIVSIVERSSVCQQEIVFSCNVAPLVLDGVSFASWIHRNGAIEEINNDNIKCKCDDDDNCMDLTVSCNCYSKLRFPLRDTIRITDMSKLPVTGFAYGPFTHPNAQAAVRLNSLECSGPPPPPPPTINDDVCDEVSTNLTENDDEPSNDGIELTEEVEQCIKLAKTCRDLAACGLNESGEYELPRPGWYGEEPMRVFCNFSTNSTSIRPKYLEEIRLQNCDGGPGCASVNVSYGVDMDQVTSVMEHSTYCKQEIVFSCNLAPLVYNGVSFASWRYRNEQNQFVTQAITQDNAECKCNDEGTCMDVSVSCNCYSKLRQSLQDTIRITDMKKLPVTGFAYGPFTDQNAQASVRLKSLECFSPFSTVTRDDCNAITILSFGRVEANMEYVFARDCYAEIIFSEEVNLKLTISKPSGTDGHDFFYIYEGPVAQKVELSNFVSTDIKTASHEWTGKTIVLRWRRDSSCGNRSVSKTTATIEVLP